ncbi:HEAT repeat domain-containing protein [Dactylosporangium cerinum]|uniref:HEAT repeat domain-containing protein n=1 Tax=Dactylosporangium cerinum TaxID=1434730 RepID=A0ABV9WBU5_9ACTN
MADDQPLDVDWGVALLDAAVRAGNSVAVDELVDRGVVSTYAGTDGVDPVATAADLGAYMILQCLLGDRPWMPRAGDAEQRALRAARPWLVLDPEAELRRRLGGGPVTVLRERVVLPDGSGTVDFTPHAIRVRAIAVDGRQSEVYMAHRGIITAVEQRLGLVVPRDELLARALFHADPGSCDWEAAQAALNSDGDYGTTYHWAAALLADASVDVRRFATEALHHMSFDARPFAAEATAALRGRLSAERDAITLDALIGAYVGYVAEDADLTDMLVLAGHPAPMIRSRVASSLRWMTASRPAAADVLVKLTSDPAAEVRQTALAVLSDEQPIDTGPVRDILAAALTDDNPRNRLSAACGLVLRGDPRGTEPFADLHATARPESPEYWRLDSTRRLLEYRHRPSNNP